MEQALTDNINIRFISTDDMNYWAELLNNENPVTIPLLLTKEEAQETLEKIKYLDISDFPFHYIRMIITGCMMIIIRGIHC